MQDLEEVTRAAVVWRSTPAVLPADPYQACSIAAVQNYDLCLSVLLPIQCIDDGCIGNERDEALRRSDEATQAQLACLESR